MLLYHFPLTSSSATATIVNKGLKDDYTISGDNNFSSGGKLSSYAKDMGENKFYLSIPNFALDYTLCFRAKATTAGLFVNIGTTPFEIRTTDSNWHDYVIFKKKVYRDCDFFANFNYSADALSFGDSEDCCQGLIQDIRVYDYLFSQAEINEYSRALVVHYPLQGNELNSSVLKDVSGFGDDYTSDSAITYGYDSPRNKYGVVTKDLLLKKGNLVNIKQLVENYDFSDGLNGWTDKPEGSMSLVDGHLHFSTNDTSGVNAVTFNTPITLCEGNYKHEVSVRYKTNNSTISKHLTFYHNPYNSPISNIRSYMVYYYSSAISTTVDVAITNTLGATTLKNSTIVCIGRNRDSIEFNVYNGNLYDKTIDFGKNNEPTDNEMNDMLGITSDDFIPAGNYVVKDTRKTIPQTLSFWVEYNSTWYHLAYNGDKYVNGTVNTALFDTIYASLESGIKMTDFRVYATVLSDADIKNLYNSPITLDNKHNTKAFEVNENVYPQNYWRTPTYSEMNYILTQRTNASNLRTLGQINLGDGTYRNGLFLLPDGFVAPSGITVNITTANYTTNSYTLAQFKQLESVGVVFFAESGSRENTNVTRLNRFIYWLGTQQSANLIYALTLGANLTSINLQTWNPSTGLGVRLINNGTKFSTSATTKIDFAPANLQYHCKKKLWRFAEHQYDIIGTANSNISDDYDGWIDLFGFGCNGVNYPATLHTTNNADYCQVSLNGTDNDWGYNMISESSGFSACKNGLVKHNELNEAIVYPSKYWHTPTYDEMNYILTQRTNASNLRTLGRVNLGDGTYRNGIFLLPDGFVAPSGITVFITVASFETNTYSILQLEQLESVGIIFIPAGGNRTGSSILVVNEHLQLHLANIGSNRQSFYLRVLPNTLAIVYSSTSYGKTVRLCKRGTQFSTSPTTKIDFAPANLQYHCTQYIWRFAQHSYDIIGADNANINDSYNGWIDLFGYGTSGVNYSPTRHTTSGADYANGDIANTDNDWGINEIQSYEYNQQLNGIYQNKILTNKLIEN